MIRNYLKTALRNLKRNKSYTIINLLGLSVGIAACLLIFLVIEFESSFDTFHKKKDSIYRIGTEFHTEDGISYSEGSAFPVAAGLRLDFPNIKQIVRLFRNEGQITVENGATELKKLKEENFFYAEPEFFDMFDFEFISGDAKSALNDPHKAVLTQETAEKYYGDWKTALGKTIKYDNEQTYTVSGILKNIPDNTDFALGVVVPYEAIKRTYLKNNFEDWVSTISGAEAFVVLPPELPLAKFNQQLRNFSKKHKPSEYSQDAFVAQPLREIHFDDRFGNLRGHIFPHSLIRALWIIAAFLIVIACVNFVNLATAQAVNRSKEVGIRKVLGSNRKQLAVQLLGETAIIVYGALIVALLIASATVPFLNKLLSTKISLRFFQDPVFVAFMFGLGIVVTFLAGIYPAVILSGFNPITALKSKITAKMIGGLTLRRALVILQFGIAHILIIGMLIVVTQMNFFRNASLGFDKAAIINVPFPGDSLSDTKVDYVKNQLLANSSIEKVCFSFGSPSSNGNWNSDFKFDHAANTTNFSANLKWADADYFKTFGLKFVAGRPYTTSDTVREFVVNETLLRKVGITDPQKAIGKEIDFWDGRKKANIVGVIRDFNAYSLRDPMAPVVLSTWKNVYQTISIKIKPGAEKSVLPFVESIWNASFPDYVYSYEFLDETIKNFYRQENQLSQLYQVFAGIAIFISCLGLYGLVSFMAVQRVKEVGIRKVLGASVRNIVYLLSKEFTLLIITAFAIGAPVAYFIMKNWLQNYTYQIPLSISIFALAMVSSIVIAWITVGHRAIRAAIANPVKSLRTE